MSPSPSASRTGRWWARLGAVPAAVTLLAALPFLNSSASAASPRAAGPDSVSASHHGLVQIKVLSNRADLVSGGDALVEIVGGRTGTAVRLNGHDISAAFATRADGHFTGLVTGLRPGRNELTAGNGFLGARITITDHPNGGPVIAGAQVQPWDCTMHSEVTGLGAPTDAQCVTPAVFRYVYMPASHAGFLPYDPAAPAADVASTTTDQGVTVPYIVRLETGTQDRGIYQVAVLFDPSRPFTATAPQAGWNRKVVYPFGGGGAPHHTSDLPSPVLDDVALSRGFLVATSGLDVQGSNNNDVVSAEAVLMLKEHVTEAYGTIRYTIGEGCSGGSIQQQVLAEQYPGLLDGILPNCSFPDLWTTSTEVLDCGLLVNYFATATGWTNEQKAAVAGTKDTTACLAWNASFVPAGLAARAQNCNFAAGDPRVYNPVSNPGGVRCEVADYQAAVWGPRPERVWTPQEQAVGHGFANNVGDNDGVLYGLAALKAGTISAAQFVDLNTKVGGFNIDGLPQPARKVADPGSTRRAYRAGQVTTGARLGDVPMIDLRGSSNFNDIHTDYHSWETRARLDALNGDHANQVIWTWRTGPGIATILVPRDIGTQAFLTMDAWLAGMEADHRPLPPALKVRLHKPAAAVDACWTQNTAAGAGPETVDPGYAGACGQAFPHFGDARNVAGENATGESLKCQLTPLRSGTVPGLDAGQVAALRAALPNGVCDWRRLPVGFAISEPWLTFAGGPGGQPLGAPPRSQPTLFP